MERTDRTRTGVLVLRAWVEGDGGRSLRVRVTRTIHGDTRELVSSAAATVDGACAIVRAWLEELEGHARAPTAGPPAGLPDVTPE